IICLAFRLACSTSPWTCASSNSIIASLLSLLVIAALRGPARQAERPEPKHCFPARAAAVRATHPALHEHDIIRIVQGLKAAAANPQFPLLNGNNQVRSPSAGRRSCAYVAGVLSGGRTRTRTLDPLIKSQLLEFWLEVYH